MPGIVFICTANQFRSPIAAAYFSRKLALMGIAADWKVGSAGTWAEDGLPAHPAAIETAAKIGLDLSRHRTREVTKKLISAADLVICMQPGQKEALETEFSTIHGRVFLLGSFASLPGNEIPDPAKDSFAHPDMIAQMIYNCIDEGFTKLLRFVNISNNDQGNY